MFKGAAVSSDSRPSKGARKNPPTSKVSVMINEVPMLSNIKYQYQQITVYHLKNRRAYVGVSLNGGTPKTPQNDHF